jgi:hypothetical protein
VPPRGVDNKQTIVANVYTDGSGIGQIRKDFTQDTWEAGIALQLNILTTIPPFQSSEAVVDALSRSGRATTHRADPTLCDDDGAGRKYRMAEEEFKLEGCHAH